MIIQVEEQHNEDEERFRKLQMHDTASLNEKLDSLIVRLFVIFAYLKSK